MFYVRKKNGKQFCAYELGNDDHPVIQQLMAEGKLRHNEDGTYAVLSQEAELGGGAGQIAAPGDYIKLDSAGCPYPNERDWFRDNHRIIQGDRYEQIQALLQAWDMAQPVGEEIQYLLEHKGLEINPEDESRYFEAPLWGTIERAAKDAVIVFYSITRAEDGRITDADFNFVARQEFNKTYDII